MVLYIDRNWSGVSSCTEGDRVCSATGASDERVMVL